MKTLNKTQQGFTLVELIIVIVILGILAVTAAPKFLNVAGDARGGTLQAVLGSVTTANSLVNAKAKIQGKNEEAAKDASLFVYEGADKIFLNYGYPVTSVVANTGTSPNVVVGLDATNLLTQWRNLLDVNSDDFVVESGLITTNTGFTALAAGAGVVDAIIIRPADLPLPLTASTAADSCYVYVTESASIGVKPIAVAVTSGCSN
jgi:MSHA pilin protein MshA